MASYAALVSLMRTIESLLHSSDHISLLPPQTLQSAYDEARRLKQVVQLLDRLISYTDDDLLDGYSSGANTSYYLKSKRVAVSAYVFESLLSTQFPTEYRLVQFSSEYDKSFRELIKLCFSGTVNVMDERIGEAVRELDGVLESLVSGFGKEPIHLNKSVDLVKAKRDIDSFTQMMKMNEEESTRQDDGGKKSKMVKFRDEFPRTNNLLSDICRCVEQVIFKMEAFIKKMDRNRSSRSSKRLNGLDGRIRVAASKLHDLLESHVSNLSTSHSDCHPLMPVPQLDPVEVKQFINSFIELKEEYIKEFSNTSPEEHGEEEEEEDVVSSSVDFDGKTKSKMVGLRDEVRELKQLLTSSGCSYGGIYSIIGMAGIAKTALAKEVFDDQSILSHFDCRVWVTIGLKRQLSEILRTILAQVNPETDKVLTRDGDESLADLERMISVSLNDRAHLIVFDDVWDSETLDDLVTLLPNKNDRSRVLVTTRLRGVSYNDWCRQYSHEKRFMSKEESWDLLREKVFGDEPCSPQLKKYGEKIAENCEGLPLIIVTVAHFLSKADKTTEYWNKVAEKENSVFVDSYDEMSKKLFPSYRYLPQQLKVCFLYMGVFPQNYEITRSKLTKLWSSEGFLEPIPKRKLELFVADCVHELVCSSLIMVGKKNNYTITKLVASILPFGICVLKKPGRISLRMS